MSEQSRPRVTGVYTVGVPVTDQDKAVDFYVGTLGLEKRMDFPMGQLGGRWIEVAAPGSVTSIALIPARDGAPAGVETGIRLAVEDAAAYHGYLTAHEVDIDELLLWEGAPPMFAMRDQDGNGLEVVQ